MSRGNLNTEIIEISKKFMGKPITIDELRLLPYIDFQLKNEGCIDRKRINDAENKILHDFEKANYITLIYTSSGKIEITCKSKEFYMFMQKVLYESYVIKESENDEKES